MSTAVTKHEPLADAVRCDDDRLQVRLVDGREIAVPIAWFPRLRAATLEQQAGHRLIGRSSGIRWDAIDEDLSVRVLSI